MKIVERKRKLTSLHPLSEQIKLTGLYEEDRSEDKSSDAGESGHAEAGGARNGRSGRVSGSTSGGESDDTTGWGNGGTGSRGDGERRDRAGLGGVKLSALIRGARGGGGDRGSPRENGVRREGGGLLPRDGNSVRNVLAGLHLQITVAGGERVGCVRVRHALRRTCSYLHYDDRVEGNLLVIASDQVKNVLAIIGGRDGRVANLDAELTASDELRPVAALDGLVVRRRKAVRENEAAKRVTVQISTMRVKLTARVGRIEVDASLVQEAGDLNVRTRLQELHSGESASRHDPSSVPRLAAVSHHSGLDVPNETVWDRRTPETKVGDTVDEHRLTLRVWALSC